MMSHTKFAQTGFTIVELVVSLSIFTVLSLGVIGLVSFVFTGSSQQANLLSDADQGRRIAFSINSELRNSVISETGAYPIASAGDQQLLFYSNVDKDSDIERVRYYLQNGKLYKGVVKPSGNPLTYNSATETTVAVQNNVANGSTPLFFYYDETYNGTVENPLAQPVNVTDVRFVKLSLRIYNKAGLKNTTFYTVTAGAAIRNLKTNLAN